MTKSYNTKQKMLIEQTVQSFSEGHFTCEDVCDAIKSKGENAGMTTVYRHLDKMVKDGAIIKYTSQAGESACYRRRLDCGEHFHLKCVSCGKLIHLSCKSLDGIGAHVENEHRFKIDPSKTVFYGVCGECK